MRIQPKSSAGISGVGTDGTDSIDGSLDDLQQILQQIANAQGGAQPNVDPTQLAQSLTHALSRLQGPQDQGQLNPDQDARLQGMLQTIGNMLQGNGAQQAQGATGFPTQDTYDPNKVEGGKIHKHGGGHHHVSAPPVDASDPDANTIQSSPTNEPE